MTPLQAFDRMQGTTAALMLPVGEILTGAGGVRLCRSSTKVRHSRATAGAAGPFHAGIGSSLSLATSRAAAVGEAFERYAVASIPTGQSRTASAYDLIARGFDVVTSAELAPYSSEQFAREDFPLAPAPGDDEVVSWLPAIDLATGRDAWVPTDACVYHHLDPETGEERLSGTWTVPTTNGVAVAGDPVRSALAALYELLERDAFTLMWHHRLRFPDIDVAADPRLSVLIDRTVRRARLAYRLIDLTEVHGVPCVVAVLWPSDDSQTLFSVGAAAAPSAHQAAVKALMEAASFHETLRLKVRSGAMERLRPEDVVEFEEHAEYYLDPDHRSAIEWLLEPVPGSGAAPAGPALDSVHRIERPDRLLAELAARLAHAGVRTYAVDLCPVETQDLGLYVYRVISPDLLPLELDHNARALGSARLFDEPVRRGWRSSRPGPADLNPDPHPFA